MPRQMARYGRVKIFRACRLREQCCERRRVKDLSICYENTGVADMNERVDRRSFIGSLGLAAIMGAGGYVAAPRPARAAFEPKGKIPTTPFKVGHMTFQSGPGA